jgi:hypothetical protein
MGKLLNSLIAFGVLCAAWTGQAWGAETDAFVRLVWIRGLNAEACPGQLEVERQVRWRLGRDPFVLDAKRLIEAKVSLTGEIWHAEINVRDNTSAMLGQRTLDVRADNCAQVVDTVGLAVALAIDPNASVESKVPPVPAQPNPNGPELAPPQPAVGPKTPWPYSQLGPTAVPPLVVRNPCRPRYDYALTVRSLAAAGLLPGLAPGVAVAGAFGSRGVQLTLGLSYLPEKSLDKRFSFGLTTASVGVCADVLRSQFATGSLCGELQVGAMHAVVYQLAPVQPGDQWFGAVGAGPKIGWHAWAPFFIEGGVTAALGFFRRQFAISGVEPAVYETSLLSAVGFIGVGVTSP